MGLTPLRSALCTAALLLLSTMPATPVFARERPTLDIEYPVDDEVGVLSAAQHERLAQRLVNHWRKTGVQMAVVLIDSTDGVPIEDYSMSLAERWKGGATGRDDGVLLLFAVNDRKSRLEVGYGLEPLLDDHRAKQLLDGVRPELREARYADAIQSVVDGVIERTNHLDANGQIEERPADDAPSTELGHNVLLVVPILMLLALALGAVMHLLHRRSGESSHGLHTLLVVVFGVATFLFFRSEGFGGIYTLIFTVSSLLVATASLIDFRSNVEGAKGFWVFAGVALMLLPVVGLAAQDGYAAWSNPPDAFVLAVFGWIFWGPIGIPLVFVFSPARPSWDDSATFTSAEKGTPFTMSDWSPRPQPSASPHNSSDSSSKQSSPFSGLFSSLSGSSSSSSSFFSSSSSSSTKYSGGGGKFGGGGASSSW